MKTLKNNVLKITVMLSLTFLSNAQILARNFFISANGNDNYTFQQAQSQRTPWKTLTKLNAMMGSFTVGDNFNFRRGDVFTGTLNISFSGAANSASLITSYGSGAYPVFDGTVAITSWTSLGNNLWETTCSSCGDNINMFLVNENNIPAGRFPNFNNTNQGYLTIQSVGNNNGSKYISDNNLSGNYTGGTVVIRTSKWTLDKLQISSHSGQTINYTGNSTYTTSTGYGYFIQNHIATLDKNYEWCYNSSTKKITMYYSGSNPGAEKIKVSTTATLLKFENNVSNFTVSQIRFIGANEQAVEGNLNTNLKINYCEFYYNGTFGIKLSQNKKSILLGNHIHYTNNVAIKFDGDTCSIKNNTISNTGMHQGMGKNGVGSRTSIIIEGNNQEVLENKITNTGYIGILFQGDNVLIKNNVIDNFASILDDGGGIYTYNGCSSEPQGRYGIKHSNRIIEKNIVLNGIGAAHGTPYPNYWAASGIYLDDYSIEVSVKSNTVANCALAGLFLHNIKNTKVVEYTDNTFYNNGAQIQLQGNGYCNDTLKNNLFKNNIFFSKDPTQFCSYLISENTHHNTFNFAKYKQNYYCRPFDETFVVKVDSPNSPKKIPLSWWQSTYNADSGSLGSPVNYPPYTLNSYNSSNKFNNSSFTSNISGVYNWSLKGNEKLVWENASQLNTGGYLKYYFTAQSGYVKSTNVCNLLVNIGSIDSTKKYLLKFTSKTLGKKIKIDVNLRKIGWPYNDLSSKLTYLYDGNAQKDYTFYLEPSRSDAEAGIQFTFFESDSTVFFDNIELYEVSLTKNNPDNFIEFIYSESSSKTVTLSRQMVDVYKNNYASGSSITLAPYSSKILMYNPNGIYNRAINFTATNQEAKFTDKISITPNPASSMVKINSNYNLLQINIYTIDGKLIKTTENLNTNNINLNIEDLIEGIYIIETKTQNGLSRIKMVKQ